MNTPGEAVRFPWTGGVSRGALRAGGGRLRRHRGCRRGVGGAPAGAWADRDRTAAGSPRSVRVPGVTAS